MCDPTWEYDRVEDEQRFWESQQAIALLPARCPKFKLGDNVTTMYSTTGDLHPITAMRFETAYPAQWWVKLGKRWYPERDVWTVQDWQDYQINCSRYRIQHESYAERQARWDADRAALDTEYRKLHGYGRRGMN